MTGERSAPNIKETPRQAGRTPAMICKPLLLVLLLALGVDAIGMKMNKIASYAHSLIQRSIVPGQQTRLCSCSEQRQCISEIEQQVQQCADGCIEVFREVTSTPQKLVPCLQELVPQFDNFADCMQSTLNSCSEGPTDQLVPYTSINQLLTLLEAEAYNKKKEIMSQSLVAKVRPVAEAAFSFAGCVKQCFVKENQNGYCFDRVQCQPKITPKNLSSSLKKCSRGFNWKKEASSLCNCAQSAGITSLQQVCPLLNAMG